MLEQPAMLSALIAKAMHASSDQAKSEAIVAIVDMLLLRAIHLGASDLHIEPYAGAIRLRYRLDGILVPSERNLPHILAAPITSRIKVMANMDIAKKHTPQDGHIPFKNQGVQTDVRVSTMPVINGETIVLRFLTTDAELLDMARLGFTSENQAIFERLIAAPNGMIAVCGPMNSGKTTTLYAALARLNNDNTNIATLEDPVERHIAGINQIQLNPKAGLTYANGLRAILRQDCDKIFLGEIRDEETAEIATRIALTGHLVLTTLHTEDTISAVFRLLEMGIKPHVLSATLTSVIAQRLVRRVCPDCSEKYSPAPGLAEAILLGDAYRPEMKLWRGRGCEKCHGTGYLGRIAIHEILELRRELREAITNNITREKFTELARSLGLKSLWSDALDKILTGKTTVTEVRRVLYGS